MSTAGTGNDPDYLGASAKAIQHHYDLGNEFYRLWLDPSLTYSCALWAGEHDTLEVAQLRKLDYLASGANAIGAGRVLDVGFGWGSMLRRLVDVHGVRHVTGLTLSAEQAKFVGESADHRYHLRLESWSDHVPEQPYDAIVSIGAMEHFATMGMSREQRLEAYRRFFTCCREWLRPGGRLGLQTIVRGHNLELDWSIISEIVFLNRHIFRESEVPWLSELCQASEGLMEVVTIRNDAGHYMRTCTSWLDSLTERRAEAVAMVGETAVQRYERYLRASAEIFRRGNGGLARIVLQRV
ncbi:class I SAM-dependent methyltransferase [Nocardia lijiangensis]|uniref:class I SAM-dependent methyltransferase n=1 Tax=Nocardia lijiangensis TaxID=299618 RepID=UPI003D7310E3